MQEVQSEVIFLQKKYGFNMGIKHITAFNSNKDITRKNFIIINNKNQIYSLDRALVSARRLFTIPNQNQGADKNQFESLSLPPYQYEIQINEKQFLTYYLKISNLTNLKISPTNLESTSLLFAYGRDILLTKLAPDNVINTN